MIIHSVEYYNALKEEMVSLKNIISAKPYSSDIPFVMKGIENEITVCEIALNSVSCEFCLHCIKSENRCAVLGSFPEGLDKNRYSCPNWVYNDVPF